jgi:hypothetical protein
MIPVVKKVLFILIAIFLAAGSGHAIITANNTTAEADPLSTNGFDWSYVFYHPDGSCVAVAPNWILTAGHVADYGGTGTLTIGGTNYLKKEIIYHPTADIALVRYDKTFPGYYGLYTSSSLIGSGTLMVGYGFTGTVTKVGAGPFATYYYNDSGSGRGTRRWGSNVISSLETQKVYDVGGVVGVRTNSGFWMSFNAGGTEAGVGIFDSGGGTFISDGGTWKLAGINTYRNVNAAQTGYDSSFAVSMPVYANWINSIIIGTNDFDGDGIANYWEQQYGTTTTGLVATSDNDSDGFSNYQEYIADTNPTNSVSFFEMSGFLASTDQSVYFTGSTGREYQVFYTTNDLADTNISWAAANSPVAGTGTNSSITVTNVAAKAFYRLKAILP